MSATQVAKRVAGSEIAAGSEVKLIPGGVAELIDLSGSGALVETSIKLASGVPVTLCIGGVSPQRLPGRTVRCQVCAIHRDSTMTYQIAITFDHPTTVVEALRETPPVSVVDSAPAGIVETVAADGQEPMNEW